MTARVFNQLLKEVLENAGLQSANWFTHSFRRGGITLAAKLGLSDRAIKAQGNWRSDCFEDYIALEMPLRNDFVDHISSFFTHID